MLKNTRKAANEEQRCFTPKDLLQKIISWRHVEIYVRQQQQQQQRASWNIFYKLYIDKVIRGVHEFIDQNVFR